MTKTQKRQVFHRKSGNRVHVIVHVRFSSAYVLLETKRRRVIVSRAANVSVNDHINNNPTEIRFNGFRLVLGKTTRAANIIHHIISVYSHTRNNNNNMRKILYTCAERKTYG
jgi:hypothetical protein